MRKFRGSIYLLLFVLTTALGGEKGTPVTNWNNVQTFDLVALQQNIAPEQGKVVGVRCNFRGKDIHHLKPNWFESSIWQKKPDGKGFADLRVMVAKKDLDSFKSIKTTSGGDDFVLYGRVERDIEANFFYLRPIGRNAVTDAKGNAMVVW